MGGPRRRRAHARGPGDGVAPPRRGPHRGRARRATARCAAGDEPALFEQVAPVAPATPWRRSPAGQPEEACGAVRAALDAWAGTDDRLTAIPLLAVGAEALEGDAAAALRRRPGGDGRRRAARRGAPPAYAAGVLSRRRARGAPASLRAAAAAFEGLGLSWWASRSLFAAGLADGRSDAAAEDLLAARRGFRAMGADGWRRRAEARLRAIGRRIPTRSRPPTRLGPGLSARELEVLAELALGLRNRDIGERLFISERTVARHLVQINAKLGVSNRTAAVRVAQETRTPLLPGAGLHAP